VYLVSATEQVTCTVYGDPHYYTFDGIRIDYQGVCRYVASKTCNDGVPAPYSVVIQQETRNYGRYKHFGDRVTFIKYVDVYVDEVNVRLLKGGSFEIDGATAFAPYSSTTQNGTTITISNSNDGIQVATSYGLTVWYEGDWHATITVPRHGYGGKLCGICGDSNADPTNDLTTLDGVDLWDRRDLSVAEKHALIGNSWQLAADDQLGLG